MLRVSPPEADYGEELPGAVGNKAGAHRMVGGQGFGKGSMSGAAVLFRAHVSVQNPGVWSRGGYGTATPRRVNSAAHCSGDWNKTACIPTRVAPSMLPGRSSTKTHDLAGRSDRRRASW